MKCERVRVWMQLYLDGRLPVRRLARLEHHLGDCAACRAELGQMEAICQAASVPLPVREPEHLTSAIMARVALVETRRSHARARRDFTWGWGDALLAALLATLATALLLALQPQLWHPVALALDQVLETAHHGLLAALGNSPEWLLWVVWVGAGVLLTLGFAGAEVRANWRRALLARLPR